VIDECGAGVSLPTSNKPPGQAHRSQAVYHKYGQDLPEIREWRWNNGRRPESPEQCEGGVATQRAHIEGDFEINLPFCFQGATPLGNKKEDGLVAVGSITDQPLGFRFI